MIFELLKRICGALEQNNIPYMLSGSIAMNVYTVPRMTRDLDIVVNLQITDIERFAAIFRKGYYFWVVSLEDLILAKLIWIQQVQSEIQMNDIRNLMQNETIDMDYLKIWTDRLHLDTFNLM